MNDLTLKMHQVYYVVLLTLACHLIGLVVQISQFEKQETQVLSEAILAINHQRASPFP